MAFLWLLLLSLCLPSFSTAYRPGDIVPMSKMGQYHNSRTVWHDMIGKHCPIFAVNREVLIPVAKPTGYTGADPYKMVVIWLEEQRRLIPVIETIADAPTVIRNSLEELELIISNWKRKVSSSLAFSDKSQEFRGSNDRCTLDIEIHPDIRNQFWDPNHWPKHVLVRYTWEEQSEIDVASGFYVLFGSGLLMSFILSIYILQSSKEKLARFVKETVAESSIPGGGGAKVE